MRKLIIIMIGITSLILLFLIFNGLLKLKEKKQIEKSRALFPEIRIYDSSQISNDKFFQNTAPIFFILNPDCYYCERQIQELIDKKEMLRKLDLYLLIPSEEFYYKKWKNKYADSLDSNMNLYRINEFDYIKYFGEMSLPAVLQYNTDKTLIISHQSYVKADWILKNMTINESE